MKELPHDDALDQFSACWEGLDDPRTGNAALHDFTAGSISYTANNLNQYTAVGAAAPTYDADGNLTNDGTYSYCYDVESRLTGILSAGTCASPTTGVASYAYDAQGRRKSKTVGVRQRST